MSVPPQDPNRPGFRLTSRKKQLRLRRADPAMVSELLAQARTQQGPLETGDDAAAGEAVSSSAEASNEELERLRTENQSLRDQFLRSRAEFENFRKRTQKEKEQFRLFASEDLVKEILPCIDNLERALVSVVGAEPAKGFKTLNEGVDMIQRQLLAALEHKGVQKINAQGVPFDPQFHEAISTRPPASPTEDGKVVEVLQAGYTIHGRLVRPAKVAIARGI